jgi:hypothetical protein
MVYRYAIKGRREREMAKKNETGKGDKTPKPGQLYGKTEVLSLGRHGRFGLAAEGDYSFAKALVSVPASLSEIIVAQRFFPVVFAGADAPIPVIVLGVSDKTGNVFVDAEGKWAKDIYVPAFLRRYPFIAVPKPGGTELALAADLGSDLVVKDGVRPFFENSKPSEAARRAFNFCATLHADFEAARQFGAALKEAGLLRQHRAEVRVGATGAVQLTNFQMIDEAKLDALDDEGFLDWRRSGRLPAAYAQLMSLASWTRLGRLASAALGA